ncbi:MAG: hypothetical protein V7746_06815 [Halioglobus sp.]
MNKIATYASAVVLLSAAGSVLADPYTGSSTGTLAGPNPATTSANGTGDLTGDDLTMSYSQTSDFGGGFTYTTTGSLTIDFLASTGSYVVTTCSDTAGGTICANIPTPIPSTAFTSVSGDSSAFTTVIADSTSTITGNWTGALDPVVPPAPSVPPVATAVPTMSAYGLALTMMGLFFVAARRMRVSAKRG